VQAAELQLQERGASADPSEEPGKSKRRGLLLPGANKQEEGSHQGCHRERKKYAAMGEGTIEEVVEGDCREPLHVVPPIREHGRGGRSHRDGRLHVPPSIRLRQAQGSASCC